MASGVITGIISLLLKEGWTGFRAFLPGLEQDGESYVVSISDGQVNDLLERVIEKEKVSVAFRPGRVFIAGSKKVLLGSVEVEALLTLTEWRLSKDEAVFVFTPDGPIEKNARGLVGKAVLMTLSVLWGGQHDEKIYQAASSRAEALTWQEGSLVCDLDQIPEVRAYLRKEVRGIQLFDILEVRDVALRQGDLKLALELTELGKRAQEKAIQAKEKAEKVKEAGGRAKARLLQAWKNRRVKD